jgi:hypothetical protein
MARDDVFGDPSLPRSTAAEGLRPQPFSKPLGHYTGAPPQTVLKQVRVAPNGNPATLVVPATRESRFVTLTADRSNFTIFLAGTQGVSPNFGLPLPQGVPYEISLPGNQELYAISDAPGITLGLNVQIAAALAGDLERRLLPASTQG